MCFRDKGILNSKTIDKKYDFISDFEVLKRRGGIFARI